MTKECDPVTAMKGMLEAHENGLPDTFKRLTEQLSAMGSDKLSLTDLTKSIEDMHAALQNLPFENKLELRMDFGIGAPEYNIADWAGMLTNMGGTVLLSCDNTGRPYEGISMSEMCEFDVVDDMRRVQDALAWKNHKKRMEIGNLITFHPFPNQAEGQPCALNHDHVLVMMCHRDPNESWKSNGTRGVAMLLNRQQMEEVAQFVKGQYDEVMDLTEEQREEHAVGTLDETYTVIAQMLEEIALHGEMQQESDLMDLKAWTPNSKPT